MAADKEIAKLIISLEGQIKDLKKDLGIAGNELDKFQKKHQGIFKNIKRYWLGYTAAIAGVTIAIRRLIAPYAAFSHKMYEINTLIGMGTKQFKEYEKAVIDVTRRVPQSAEELAAALYDIISAGVAVKDSIRVMELSAKAAVAGVTDTKIAVRAGLAVINAYGKSIEELDEVYDTLFQTVKKGVVTFPELAGSIGTVLPTARAADIAFTDIAASIATMTKAGIPVNRATTFMRSGINALVAPTEEARAKMEAIGITWKGWIPTLKQIHEKGLNLKQMRQLIPDIRAGQAVINLSQNFEVLNETLRDMEDASGSMQDAYDIMMESPVNQIKMLGNVITDLGIVLVKVFSPGVIAMIKGVTIALSSLANVILRVPQATDSLRLEKFKNDLEKSAEWIKKWEQAIREAKKGIVEAPAGALGAEIVSIKEAEKILDSYKKNVTDTNIEIKTEIKTLGEEIESYQKAIADAGNESTSNLQEATATGKIYVEDFEKFVATTAEGVSTSVENMRVKIGFYKDEITALRTLLSEAKVKKVEGLVLDTKTAEKQQKIYVKSMALFEEQVKSILAKLERDYEQNRISIAKYYAKKKEMAKASIYVEINQRKELLLQLKDENKIRDVNTKILALKVRLKTELNKLTYEEIKAEEDLIKVEEKAYKLPEDIEARVDLDKSSQYAKDLAELQKRQSDEAKIIVESIKNRIEQEKLLKKAHVLWQMEKDKLLVDYEREMQQKRMEMASAAAGSLKSSFTALYAASGEQIKAFFLLSQAAALAEAIINGALAITKAYSIDPHGILPSITAIAVGTEIGTIIGTTINGLAKGGEVEGQSGIDKVPTRLTKGEYVEPTSAVDYYGKDIMEALRRRMIPKELFSGYGKGLGIHTPAYAFAEGGMAAETAETRELGLQINNIVDPNLMLDALNTKPGQAMVMNIISENAYEIKKGLRL